MQYTQKQQPHGKVLVVKNLRRLRIGLITIFLIILTATAILIAFSGAPIGLYVALFPLVVLVAMLVVWHSRSTAYNCPECGGEFSISPLVDFVSPHYPHKKLLACPKCGTVNWCEAHSRR